MAGMRTPVDAASATPTISVWRPGVVKHLEQTDLTVDAQGGELALGSDERTLLGGEEVEVRIDPGDECLFYGGLASEHAADVERATGPVR
jgi:hypothetical protein